MTDIERYDRAVASYLLGLSPKILYSPTDRAVKNIAKLQTLDDKAPWSFISFYRHSDFEFDPSRSNFSAQSFGDLINTLRDDATGKDLSTYVRNIPINLTYTVDVWAATNARVQEISLALIERLAFTQRVLTAPLNPGGADARFHIIDLDWVDNSDIENEESYGRLYRHSISFTINAVLELTRTSTTIIYDLAKLPVDIYGGSNLNDAICQECDFGALTPQG
jgi:hypothetical protein